MHRIFCYLSALALLFALVSQAHAGSSLQTELATRAGLKQAWVKANGLRFHYVEKGQGDVLLFLHGYPFFWRGWQNLLDAFAASHRVIAVDNRGYNLSDKPRGFENYSLDHLVKDVEQQILALAPNQKVTLIGHDWGGTLAWAVAQKHPRLLDKVVVINAPPLNTLLDLMQNNAEQRKSSAYMEILKSGKVEEKFAAEGPLMLWNYGFYRQLAKGYLNEDDRKAYYDAWSQPHSLASALNWYRANMPAPDTISDSDYWPSKDSMVDVDSLLIWTEGERVFVPETRTAIRRTVPNVEVVTLSGSGHSPFIDKPAEVVDAMRQFFSR